MTNKYVDFSAANDGDGTDAAQAGSPGGVGAFKTLVGKTFTNTDVVWLRRSGSLVVSTQYTWDQATFIGWPKSTDIDYGSRPASGTSAGWDVDSNTYAEIQSSAVVTGSFGFGAAFIVSPVATIRRIKLNHTPTTNAGAFRCLSPGGEIRYCFIRTAVQGNPSFSACAQGAATPIQRILSTTFEATDQATCFDDLTITAALDFIDCTFQKVAPFVADSYVVKVCSNRFSRCTFVANGTTGSSCCLQTNPANTSPDFYAGPWFTNCTFDNSLAASYQRRAIEINGKATFRSCSILGTGFKQNVSAMPPGHFSKVMQTVSQPTDVAFQVVKPWVVKFDNVTFTSGNQNDVALGDGVTALFANVTFKAAIPVRADGAPNFIYVQDEGGLSGNWRLVTYFDSTAAKSPTARTGGETFAILTTKTQQTPAYTPIEVFGWPGFETVYVPLVPGSNTVTMYCSHKNFESDPPTADDVWFEFDYLDAGVGPSRANASTKAQGALTADGSTWTGDVVTGFKLVKVLTVSQGQVVGIRAYNAKMHVVTGSFPVIYGQVYFDPKVVVA